MRTTVLRLCFAAMAASLLASCATTGSIGKQTEGQAELDAWLSRELNKRGVLAGPESPSTTLKGV